MAGSVPILAAGYLVTTMCRPQNKACLACYPEC